MSNILIILCLVVIGVAAFFFGTIYAVCHALASVGRGAVRVMTPRGRRRTSAMLEAAPVRGIRAYVCPREGCRHVEHRKASYCSQCGAKLDGVSEERSS